MTREDTTTTTQMRSSGLHKGHILPGVVLTGSYEAELADGEGVEADDGQEIDPDMIVVRQLAACLLAASFCTVRLH